MAENTFATESQTKLSKVDRLKVWWRSTFLQGSWNYERMQNGGYCYAMVPALKKLYTKKEDQVAALKRHMEFFNTTPFMASPILGVNLALEEERAAGGQVDDAAINGVKVGMMGPLAGVGDPVFWFTARPIIGSLWTNPVLPCMEPFPDGLHVVHPGIWLQGRFCNYEGPVRWVTANRYPGSIHHGDVCYRGVNRTVG